MACHLAMGVIGVDGRVRLDPELNVAGSVGDVARRHHVHGYVLDGDLLGDDRPWESDCELSLAG